MGRAQRTGTTPTPDPTPGPHRVPDPTTQTITAHKVDFIVARQGLVSNGHESARGRSALHLVVALL